MKKAKRPVSPELRGEAERRLAVRKVAGTQPPSRPDQQRLIHELEVHQIELEIQNEAFVVARLETQEAIERYLSLFDFARIGYTMLRKARAVRG